MRPVVRVLHSLARSGGTLFSRCLGCMDGVMLMSEVHPTVPMPAAFVVQAREWHSVVFPEGVDFVSQVKLLDREAEFRGQRLVLRDWSHVDFVSCEEAGWCPSNFSALRDVMSSCYEVRSLCLVRNIDDTWRSMTTFPGTAPGIVNGTITRDGFERSYRAFERFAGEVGSVSYEGLCEDPVGTVRRACDQLDLSFDPEFLAKWQSYRKVTGDTASFDRTEIFKF